jgi:GNAT superfamily N-acetyltransferase
MLGLRRAVPADVTVLRAVAVAAYEHYVPRIGRPPAPMTADYAAAVGAGNVYLAVDGDRVVGFAVLVPRPDHLLLDNVAVLPAEQGRGVGARLLALTEETARRLGLPEVRLYTNEAMTENLAYYPRHGYVETHRAEQDGYRRVFFHKPLKP